MQEPKPGEPWAFIAHKDNHWAGVCAATGDREAGKFLAEFARDGFAITTVFSRDEYNKVLDGMKCWSKHPDYKPKRKRA